MDHELTSKKHIAKKKMTHFAVKGRDNLTDGLGSTGAGGDDVGRSTTATTPVLTRWAIDGLLGSSSAW